MGIVASIMVPHPPLIVPAVGRGEERVIAATVGAYERAAAFVMSFAPETLIVSTFRRVLERLVISRSSARRRKLSTQPTTQSSCASLRPRRKSPAFRRGLWANATNGSTTA